jgi:hypothetical protein
MYKIDPTTILNQIKNNQKHKKFKKKVCKFQPKAINFQFWSSFQTNKNTTELELVAQICNKNFKNL